ncbi:hypothetical protein, partial [Actinacidiphila oryziradicis]|uniref:hypothetical protein n=1 Tax=Actinacidiphila oryziradicis TaxID=2571141 RepID=UPI0023F291AD
MSRHGNHTTIDQQVTETFGVVPAVEQTAVLPAVDDHYSPDPAERPSQGHRRPRRRPSRGLVGACAGSAGIVLLVGAALLLVSTQADGGAVREQAPTVPASS